MGGDGVEQRLQMGLHLLIAAEVKDTAATGVKPSGSDSENLWLRKTTSSYDHFNGWAWLDLCCSLSANSKAAP
jgi:hypothetical protein